MTYAEQLKNAAEKMKMGKVAGLMFLCSKNEHIVDEEYSTFDIEFTIYNFKDGSNLILDSEEETIELNATKDRLKEIKNKIKQADKKVKLDSFYSTGRNWSDNEMDLYL